MLTKAGTHVLNSYCPVYTGLYDDAASAIDSSNPSTSEGYKPNRGGSTLYYLPTKICKLVFENGQQAEITKNVSGADGAITIGSGTTPATSSDEALENPIYSGFSYSVTQQRIKNSSGKTIGKKYLLGITNTSQNNLTISEVGIMQNFRYATSPNSTSSSGNYDTFLIDRTLLASPITIPPGESASIDYTFTLS